MSHELDRTEFAGRRAATMADLRRLLDVLIAHFNDRDNRNATVTVAATVNDLPSSAAPTRLFRVAADPNGLYVGNGPNRPLSRTTLTPLS